MDRSDSPGFTLIELVITFVVIGLILAFAIPSYQSFTQTHALHGTIDNMAVQLRLAREKALATGVDQPMRFEANTTSSDYRIVLANGQVPAKWKFPNGITYQSVTSNTVTMQKDGRASASNTVVLKDQRGRLDTLSVLISGLVLTN